MDTRDVALKVKGLDDSGEFTGYAAVYDERDQQDDVILKGAFKQAVASQGNGYPLLWAHQQSTPVGIARVEDSPSALIVHGSIDRADPDGERTYNRVKKGYVKGISIGFTLPRGENKTAFSNGVRYLKEVTLHEISLVSVPAQAGARVVSVKCLADVRSVLRDLEAGDCDSSVLTDLKAIDGELKRLLARSGPADCDASVLRELRQFAEQMRRP